MSSNKRKRKDVTVEKTIKVTEKLHRWLLTIQETQGGTISGIIERLVVDGFPDIEEAAQALEKNRQKGLDVARKLINKENGE